jgi:DNA-directed RNA polymerase subunit RPC12/RpoP
MSHVEVSVLGCASCGAPVPFGDENTLVCAYCGASVAVPEEHQALREAEQQYNQHRTDAQALLRKLGKTPSVLVRFLTNASGVTVIWLVPLATIVSGVLCAVFFAFVAKLWLTLFRVHLDDVVLYRYDPNALFVIGQFAFLFASLGALAVLGAYTRRRGAGLRELQAGLSARPPIRAGGPATCRSCGAPLAAKPEDLAVTCTYCRADNLLKIREIWIGSARDRVKKLARAVEEAAYAFQDEERAIRRSLIVRLVVVGVISSTSLFLFVGVTDAASLEYSTTTVYHRTSGDFYRFDWQESVKAPSLVLDHGDTKGCNGSSCFVSLKERPCAERKPSALVVPRGACSEEVCMMHWYVALRRGDTLELTASELPPQTFVQLKSHTRGAPFHEDPVAWGPQVPEGFAWLSEGQPARLPAAPHDGWFQLVLGLGSAIPGSPLPFCARLDRAGP